MSKNRLTKSKRRASIKTTKTTLITEPNKKILRISNEEIERESGDEKAGGKEKHLIKIGRESVKRSEP